MIIHHKIQGWLAGGEATRLQRYAKEQQGRSKSDFLEIGSWKGKSGITIASILKNGQRLWMIDHFQGAPEWPHKPKSPTTKYFRNGRLWAYPELLENIIRFDLQNKVIILPLNSAEAAKIVNEQFCFIYIDGDHSYAGVSADFQLWFPHLEQKGVIIFHDFKHPPINKFCNELAERKDLKERERGTLAIFERLEK